MKSLSVEFHPVGPFDLFSPTQELQHPPLGSQDLRRMDRKDHPNNSGIFQFWETWANDGISQAFGHLDVFGDFFTKPCELGWGNSWL